MWWWLNTAELQYRFCNFKVKIYTLQDFEGLFEMYVDLDVMIQLVNVLGIDTKAWKGQCDWEGYFIHSDHWENTIFYVWILVYSQPLVTQGVYFQGEQVKLHSTFSSVPHLAAVQHNPGVPEVHAILSIAGTWWLSCVPGLKSWWRFAHTALRD